ncbi:MAG: hypothetical protein QHC40_07690 [Sphingobium sp.]|nr:hypothetical protein [Sphingobium sp.]
MTETCAPDCTVTVAPLDEGPLPIRDVEGFGGLGVHITLLPLVVQFAQAVPPLAPMTSIRPSDSRPRLPDCGRAG